MENINNAVNTGVNNIEEEMKMKNINNNGVNNEWLEVIETYVKVKNAGTLESMINNGKVVTPLWKRYGSMEGESESIDLKDGCLITIITLTTVRLANDPKIIKGLRVIMHDAHGETLEDVLYLTVDGDEIGRDEVSYELQIDETVKTMTNKEGERYMVNIKNNEVELDEVKVITLGDHQFINGRQLWETIGAPSYTLPLIYVIENVITSYVENDDLDEEVMNHTDKIIETLVTKGDFVYIVKDGELQVVEGIHYVDLEAVELYIPYLAELEKAADELLGFWTVVNNMDVSDREKNEMKNHVFPDELYSFVYQYCREVWWDGGSN